MTSIFLPEELARNHADPARPVDVSASANAAAIGKSWVKRFVSLGGLRSTDNILDVGCGPGRMAIAIGDEMKWKNKYIGFDVREEDVIWATNNINTLHPDFSFKHIDVSTSRYNTNGKILSSEVVYPCEENWADFVLATSIFSHMFTGSLFQNFVEARRCLKHQGHFLFTGFILDEHYNVSSHRRYAFDTCLDGAAFVAVPDAPEKAVAYRKEFIVRMLSVVGFSEYKHFPGSWKSSPGAKSGQDIFVCW